MRFYRATATPPRYPPLTATGLGPRSLVHLALCVVVDRTGFVNGGAIRLCASLTHAKPTREHSTLWQRKDMRAIQPSSGFLLAGQLKDLLGNLFILRGFARKENGFVDGRGIFPDLLWRQSCKNVLLGIAPESGSGPMMSMPFFTCSGKPLSTWPLASSISLNKRRSLPFRISAQ